MQQIDPNVQKFLNQLLDEANMSEKILGKDVRDQMFNDLYTRLEDRLILTALEHLDEAGQEEFEKLSETEKNPDKIKNFLTGKIPNITGIFQKAMVDFKNVYLQGVKKA